MVFGIRHILDKFDNVNVMYNGDWIENVESFKYLGVTFDPLLSWCEHVNHTSSKISQRIGVIRRIKFYLRNDILNMLAKALVMPHFNYCSPVWTNCNTTLLNSLQIHHNRLARILLSADIRTRIDDMMNSLNWFRLNRWENQLLLMLFKCLTHEAPPYLCSQFRYTQSIHTHGTRS